MTAGRRMVVVAPHPDDEVLGAGGALARRAAEGWSVHVVIATRGRPPLYSDADVERGRAEAASAHRILGVASTRYLDFPAAQLDTVPHHVLNARVGAVVEELSPDELYLPFPGDIHRDHQLVFESGLVASRPHGKRFARRIFCYETLSETNWNAAYLTPGFTPNHFVEITAQLEAKVQAAAAFASQMRAFPHERSIEAIRALAALRGASVGMPAAEAFVTVRTVE